MLKKITAAILLCCAVLTTSFAQNAIDKTLETFAQTIAGFGLGTAESDFYTIKSKLPKVTPDPSAFRDEVEEVIGQNGMVSAIYYFDAEGDRPLYELILTFDSPSICQEMAQNLFGKPNYPDRPDHWIAGAQNGIVTIAWMFDAKLVIAANFPGSEWSGDEMFNIPPGFELYKHLPTMSEWPDAELARFQTSLEQQIAAGATDFMALRGEETEGFFACKEPLATAESGNVLQGDDKKWVVSNTLISGASAENSITWKLDAETILSRMETKRIKLSRTKSKSAFGSMVSLWDVIDKSGKPTTMQVGIMNYEWGAEGLWNVDVLVLQK